MSNPTPPTPQDPHMRAFISAYIECAFWSSMDNADEAGGEPLDINYGPEDLTPAAERDMMHDCELFIIGHRALLEEWNDWSGAGHDFWLTRNGHGAGFWDRGRGALGELLSEAARKCGTSDLTIGDDGRVHV